MAEVQYRNIPDFPGYRVGSDGTVWSCWRRGSYPILTDNWRLLTLKTDKAGYVSVSLKKADGYHWFLVHRLVLECFIGPCPYGLQCRHFPDRSRSNNNLSNLSWGTVAENTDDKRKHGTTAKGEIVGTSKLTEPQIFSIRHEYASGKVTQTDLAIRYGVSQANISEVVTQKSWRHVQGVGYCG